MRAVSSTKQLKRRRGVLGRGCGVACGISVPFVVMLICRFAFSSFCGPARQESVKGDNHDISRLHVARRAVVTCGDTAVTYGRACFFRACVYQKRGCLSHTIFCAQRDRGSESLRFGKV